MPDSVGCRDKRTDRRGPFHARGLAKGCGANPRLFPPWHVESRARLKIASYRSFSEMSNRPPRRVGLEERVTKQMVFI